MMPPTLTEQDADVFLELAIEHEVTQDPNGWYVCSIKLDHLTPRITGSGPCRRAAVWDTVMHVLAYDEARKQGTMREAA